MLATTLKPKRPWCSSRVGWKVACVPRGEYSLNIRPSGFLFSAVFATVVAARAVLSYVVLGTEDALMYKLISP